MNSAREKSSARPSGMTLIESFLVILVMLVVIAVVFTGTRTWKRNSDRTACINNIRNVQHVVRSYQNLHGLPAQTPINIRDEFIGPKLHLPTEPECPSYGHYDYAQVIPPVGRLAVTCSLSNRNAHQPSGYEGW